MRYQIVDEDSTQQDLTHFEKLRSLEFFADFLKTSSYGKCCASASGAKCRIKWC